MVSKIISAAKSEMRGLPMAMVTFAVCVGAYKLFAWAVDKVLPGKGAQVKALADVNA